MELVNRLADSTLPSLYRGLPLSAAFKAIVAKGSVLTIGNFDGVHPGHQLMLERVAAAARERGLPSIAVSFDPSPNEYFLGKETAPPRIQSLRDRHEAIGACGIEHMLMLHFHAALAGMEADTFVRSVLLEQLNMRHVVVGDDFRFGLRRRGDYRKLELMSAELNFTAEETPTLLIDENRLSSTRIRDSLGTGDLKLANKLLGRPWRISGRVIRGNRIGTEFGFPTANIALKDLRPPLSGVSAVRAIDRESGQVWRGVANLGARPTVDGTRMLLEVHVFDDSPELYGKILSVDFLHWMRPEQRYDTFDELKAQIAEDARQARLLLQDHPAF